MKIIEVLLAIAFIVFYIGLSHVVKRLSNKYMQKYNGIEAQKKIAEA